MSLVTIQGNASGTGTLTIAAPNTNSNFTLTLPAATTTFVGTDATQTLTNKTLTSPTLTTPNINSAQVPTVSGTAPLYMCRAWVNFNGTGVVAVRASGNVTDITDGGTGTYTVNFTTAMSDADYSGIVACGSGTTSSTTLFASRLSNTPTSSAFQFQTYVTSTTAALNDPAYVNVAVFR